MTLSAFPPTRLLIGRPLWIGRRYDLYTKTAHLKCGRLTYKTICDVQIYIYTHKHLYYIIHSSQYVCVMKYNRWFPIGQLWWPCCKEGVAGRVPLKGWVLGMWSPHLGTQRKAPRRFPVTQTRARLKCPSAVLLLLVRLQWTSAQCKPLRAVTSLWHNLCRVVSFQRVRNLIFFSPECWP